MLKSAVEQNHRRSWGGAGGSWPHLAKIFTLAEQNLVSWQKGNWQFVRKEWESLKVQKQNMASIPLFLHILSIFLPSLSVFSHFCLVSAICLPIFLPFLPVFESSFSNFCPMLRLAEQCDTKERYISLAEQNWRIWPPLRGYFLAEQDSVLAERNCWPPLKNAPGTPMGYRVVPQID